LSRSCRANPPRPCWKKFHGSDGNANAYENSGHFLAGVGDTLLATPLIHELRAIFPTAMIDVLVLWPGSRDVLEEIHTSTPYFRKPDKGQQARQAGSVKILMELAPAPLRRFH